MFKAREVGFKLYEEKVQKEKITKLTNVKAPIQQVDFQLHTIQRRKSRDLFKQKMMEKEREMHMMELVQEEERRRQDEEEVKRLRNELNFKAGPIKKYKNTCNIAINENRQLTVPVAPKLHTSTRA